MFTVSSTSGDGTSSHGVSEVRDIGEDFVGEANSLGERLAKGFEEIGEYHVFFWNCQVSTFRTNIPEGPVQGEY
jgi:hypothetical protein